MKGCGITHIANKTLLEIQRNSGKTILLLLPWKLDDIWQLIGRGLDSSSCQILINDLLDNVSHPPHDKLAPDCFPPNRVCTTGSYPCLWSSNVTAQPTD